MTHLIYLCLRLYRSELTFLLIPLISLGLGLALLFSSFCIFNGLHEDFYLQIESNHANYILEPSEGYFFYDAESRKAVIQKNLPEASVGAVLMSQGLLHIGDKAAGILLRGEQGLEDNGRALPSVQISKSLARDLLIEKNQAAELVLADGSHHDIHVTEIFDDFQWPELKYTVKMSLKTCQDMLFEDQMVNRFEIRFPELLNPNNISLMELLQKELENTKVTSWQEIYSETLLLFKTEKNLHIFFLVLFSAFLFVSTYASFTLIFLRKRNSIKSLRMLGWTKSQEFNFLIISSHFLIVTAFVTGVLISATIKLGLYYFPLQLPQSLFYSQFVPFNWQWNFLLGTSLMIYFTSLASIALAWREVFSK